MGKMYSRSGWNWCYFSGIGLNSAGFKAGLIVLSLILPFTGMTKNFTSKQNGKWKAAFNWQGGGWPDDTTDNATIKDSIHIESGNDHLVGNFNFNQGGDLHVQNGGSLKINGTLDLNGGSITVDSSAELILTENATLTGISNSNFIDGPYQMKGSDSLVFKLKGANEIVKLTIHKLTTLSAYKVSYHGDNPQNRFSNSFDTSIKSISHEEYFDIQRTKGSGRAMVSLFWNQKGTSTAINSMQSLSDLVIAHYDSSSNSWNNYGRYNIQGNKSDSGYITSDTINSFSPFTFGSTSTASPLPVELIEFNAQKTVEGVKLSWFTASEQNNRLFILQRRHKNNQFENLDTIKGQGTTTEKQRYRILDKRPPKANSIYYRLKQVDYDGKYEYSEIKGISNDQRDPASKTLQFHSIAPNPVSFPLRIQFIAPEAGVVKILWIDRIGRKVSSQLVMAQKGLNTHTLNAVPLHRIKGVQQLVLSQSDQVTSKSILISK